MVNPFVSIHASILPNYGNPSANKKVDFCIFVNPSNEPTGSSSKPSSTAISSIESLCLELPNESFNFTDFTPLERRPIALSIETKKPGEGWEGARLQLGVWLMAHWNFLAHLVEMTDKTRQEASSINMQESAESLSLDEENRESSTAKTPHGTENNESPTPLPEFLPGIIIQGHQWDLIITTFEGRRTTFWHKLPMGNTLDTKGIYKLVHSLQILRGWVENVYWPWLRELVLRRACRTWGEVTR